MRVRGVIFVLLLHGALATRATSPDEVITLPPESEITKKLTEFGVQDFNATMHVAQSLGGQEASRSALYISVRGAISEYRQLVADSQDAQSQACLHALHDHEDFVVKLVMGSCDFANEVINASLELDCDFEESSKLLSR